jgi:hypothetical protein
MRTSTYQLSENFINNGKVWEIKKNSPPTEKQAGEIIAALMNLKGAANLLDDETSWMLGNIVAELRDFYGKDFSFGILSNLTSMAENLMRNAEMVFRAFRETRVRGLTFTHHKEVFYTKGLKQSTKIKVLRQALHLQLNAKEVRSLAKIAVTTGTEFLKEDKDPMDVMNAIHTKPLKEQVFALITKRGLQQYSESELTDELRERADIIIKITPTLELIKNAQQEGTS